jgi:hypothetical protein
MRDLLELLVVQLFLRYWWQTLQVLVLLFVGRAAARGVREERARRKLLTRLAGDLRRVADQNHVGEG